MLHFLTVAPSSTRLRLSTQFIQTRALQIFGEEHISYCTTVREADLTRNVIFSGYIAFYQINTFL